ncbi:MAG: hypothetical protein GF320_17860 [Armatimonadia bacterium]|nr:hypothetical protein [Armatimonadia bacterium]
MGPERPDARRFVRLSARIPMRYAELMPGRGDESREHATESIDLGGGGISFETSLPLAEGAYVRIDLHPPGVPPLEGLQGLVVSTDPTEDDCSGCLARVSFMSPPHERLHALILETYAGGEEVRHGCSLVRHCGDLKQDCPAFGQKVNCWEIEAPPCCHWPEDRDCVACPVSQLVFVT